jgi:hypothetical protein
MITLLHVVAEMPQFIRDADAVGWSDDERRVIIDAIAANPLLGDEIRESGGVRKVRFARRGKRKSGGYCVVTAYFGSAAPVYLVALLSKGERANFTAAEIAAFKQWMSLIARSGVGDEHEQGSGSDRARASRSWGPCVRQRGSGRPGARSECDRRARHPPKNRPHAGSVLVADRCVHRDAA